MKILGICILMMGLLMTFSRGLDLLQGFDKDTSLHNALSPFRVMELPELGVLFFFLFHLVIETSINVYQKRKTRER